MNVVRIGGEVQFENGAAGELISERPGMFVPSPTGVRIRHLQRQIEFHGREWMLGKFSEGGKRVPLLPMQALIHRERYESTSQSLRELRELGAQASEGAGVELLPFYGAEP